MVCPIAGYKIDEKSARVVAGFVVLLVVVALASSSTPAKSIFVFLALDFGVRAFSRPRLSLLGLAARWILGLAKVQPSLVDAGPKRFAARIGLVFSIALFLLGGFGSASSLLTVGGILLFCALLESVFGICLGCHAWTLWYRILPTKAGKIKP